MGFKPTGVLDWILLGYGALICLVALVVTPLVIGLGDDSANSSPLRVVHWPSVDMAFLGGGGSLPSGSRWRSRARRSYSRSGGGGSMIGGDACDKALDRLIECSPAEAQKVLRARKEQFARMCRKRDSDVQKARRCLRRISCSAFKSCLSGS